MEVVPLLDDGVVSAVMAGYPCDPCMGDASDRTGYQWPRHREGCDMCLGLRAR
jgi:hypothetical protein